MAGTASDADGARKERSDDGLIDSEFTALVLTSILDDITWDPARKATLVEEDRMATLSELLGLDYGDDGPPPDAPPPTKDSLVLYDRVVSDGAGNMVRVVQPRVVKQPSATGICGYKALFHAVVANHYCRALSESVKGAPGAPLAAVACPTPSSLGRLTSGSSQGSAAESDGGPTSSQPTPPADDGHLPAGDEARDRAAGPPRSSRLSSASSASRASARPSWFSEMRTQLASRACFWRLFTSLKAELIDNAYRTRRRGALPLWSDRRLWGDVLERPDIALFMRNGSPVLEDLPAHMTVCLEFGAASLRSGAPRKAAAQVAEACRRFADSDHYHHTFLLGLATHWIAVSAVKYPNFAAGTGAPPRFAVIVMDSENHRGMGSSRLDILRRVASIESWDHPERLRLPLWMEVSAAQDTIEGIQSFVSLVVRGITGSIDIGTVLEHTAMRGHLAAFPPAAFVPASPDPIDADAIAHMFGRAPLYRRPLQSAERFAELFPQGGPALREALARQEVSDLEAGIAALPDPDDGAMSPAKAAERRAASEAESRAIVGGLPRTAPERLSAWDQIRRAEAGRVPAAAADTVVQSVLEWQRRSYPTTLALRLLRSLGARAEAVRPEYRRDLASFAQMLGFAGEHATSGRCAVEMSDNERLGVAAVAAQAWELVGATKED